MNLKQIEALRLVIESGSVSAAARHLGLSQSGVSRMLRSLEASLGTQLFDHRRGGLATREELRDLLPEIERAYQAVMDLQARARSLGKLTGRNLLVGCSAATSLSVIGPACARVIERHPRLKVSIRVRNGPAVLDQLAEEAIDLAVTQVDQVRPGLRLRSLGPVGLMCVLPRTHALAGSWEITPAQLAEHPLVAYAPHTQNGARSWAFFRRHGIAPDVMTVDQAALACLFAARLGRIAIVESLIDVETLHPELIAVRLTPPISYAIYGVWHDRPQPPTLPIVVAEIERTIGALAVRRGFAEPAHSGEHARPAVEDIVGQVA